MLEKIQILQKYKTSHEIYEQLESCLQGWYWATYYQDNLSVTESPDMDYKIDLYRELLSDLAEYTYLHENSRAIPDNLEYITDYWNVDSDEDE
jgi:hypothetical protein